MKKLNKLNISSDKFLKDEELINLKGGYDGGCTGMNYYWCTIVISGTSMSGAACASSAGAATSGLWGIYPHATAIGCS